MLISGLATFSLPLANVSGIMISELLRLPLIVSIAMPIVARRRLKKKAAWGRVTPDFVRSAQE